MAILKEWKVKAVVTKVEDGKVYYDVGELFQATHEIEELEFIPDVGEELIYTVRWETFSNNDDKRK